VRWLLALSLLWIAALICATTVRAQQSPAANVESLAALLELVIDADSDSARTCLQTMAERIRTSEIDAATIAALQKRLSGTLGKIITEREHPLRADAILLAALWRDPAAIKVVSAVAQSDKASTDERQVALATLIYAKDTTVIATAAAILMRHDDAARPLQLGVLTALSRSEDPTIAPLVLGNYPQLAADSQAQALELLTQRVAWSKPLLSQIAADKIPRGALNINQVRKLLSHGDAEIKSAVARLWGTIREGRDPAREQLVRQMRSLLAKTPGDSHRGMAVFTKLCGQCHKIHGEGQEVGPDITVNGRASYDQLLSNVFDPSLVIGEAYQARTVRTADGRVITGLLAEDSEQRIVLKVQGGKLETIARDDVQATKVSELSLMPEGIEKQLEAQEIADLFAFITLDKHPDDKNARLIPGTVLPK
jgi:putative heme-binding domain-containing protein